MLFLITTRLWCESHSGIYTRNLESSRPLVVLCSQLTLECGPPPWPALHWWTQPIPLLPVAHKALLDTTQQISSPPLRSAWLRLRVIRPLSLGIHHKLRCGRVLHLTAKWIQLWSQLIQQQHAVRNILFSSKVYMKSPSLDWKGVQARKRGIFGFNKHLFIIWHHLHWSSSSLEES